MTLIEGEDLDHIEEEHGIRVKSGEHRRNIVTRGLRLDELRRRRRGLGLGKRFSNMTGHAHRAGTCRI